MSFLQQLLNPPELITYCLIGMVILGSLSHEVRKWQEAGR